MNRLKFGVTTGLILICGLLIKCSDYQGDLINNVGVSQINITVPEGFPKVVPSKDNPLTEEGVALGRKLFFDPILSKNNNVS